MNNAGTDGNRQIHAFAFYDLRNALPALAALAVLFVAAARSMMPWRWD